jgi:hypothetical protein
VAKLWKCYNCLDDRAIPGRDFFADTPVCPKCGADKSDPQAANTVVACRIVHLEPPHPFLVNKGTGTIACGFVRTPDTRITGETLATNCPKCRASDAYKAAFAVQHPDDVEE